GLIQPHDYPACAVVNNQIYIIGGHHPDATEGGPSTDPAFSFTERWNGSSSQLWEAVDAMPTPRFAASAVSIDGRLWVLGGVAAAPEGFHEYDLIEIYDPETSKWQKSSLALPWPSAGQGAVVLNRALYVFGGFREDIGIGKHGTVFNFADKSWSSLPPMPHDRAAMGVAVVDEIIYLIGGWRADRSVKDTVVGFKHG
ncbi:MAG: Kelch repeat-containing protein, partial [Nitrospiria bacterium]